MSGSHDMERLLVDWMASAAPSTAPRQTVDDAISTTSQRRPRPAWLATMRIPPMTTQRTALVGSPYWRAAYLLVILAIAAALAVGGIAAGASLLAQASEDAMEPAPPTGLARNGLIAFAHDGDIWVIEPDGSNPRPLVATPELDGPAIWSPDGTRLAFWSFASDGDGTDMAAVDAAMADPDPNMSVNVVRADGTDHQVLMSGIKWASPCGTDLSWAHDSEHLAVSYTATEDGAEVPVIEILSVDGEPSRRLLSYGVDPSWSPDDRALAYHGVVTSNGVWIVGADGTDPRQLSGTTGSGCAFDGPAWSPDGSQVAFYGGPDGAHDVWVAEVDGTGELRLSTDLADEYWPRWSPDGSRLAFDRVVDPANNAPQFVVSDPDGGNQAMLDHAPVAARYPTWSPDGRSILGMLLSDDHTEVVGLLLIDAAGVAEPVELYRGLVLDPSWQRLAP
jgi:TolB protein